MYLLVLYRNNSLPLWTVRINQYKEYFSNETNPASHP